MAPPNRKCEVNVTLPRRERNPVVKVCIAVYMRASLLVFPESAASCVKEHQLAVESDRHLQFALSDALHIANARSHSTSICFHMPTIITVRKQIIMNNAELAQ